MDSGTDKEWGKLQSELQSLAAQVWALAESCQGDNLRLLALLRILEGLHGEIRDGLFQASLPDNRQALYKLLRNIESEGGWPYIQRMKLQAFLGSLDRVLLPEDREKESERDATQTRREV